jgi:hypothetical protein
LTEGSFAEDKDHPNDIEGYFECGLKEPMIGELERKLNLLDPSKVWTWDPSSRKPCRGYPKKQLPMWHRYERLKRGEFEELENLRGLGNLLISLRIAQGMSQRELARRLDLHELQVSRDGRNEYFGITLERAIKILDALNVRLHTKVEIKPPREMVANGPRY